MSTIEVKKQLPLQARRKDLNRQLREEAENRRKEDAKLRRIDETERIRREDASWQRRQENERMRMEEEKRKRRKEAEWRRGEEAKRKKREETDRKSKEDAERKKRKEADWKRREEAERTRKEEAERTRREEAERTRREEFEFTIREEEERTRREEAERKRREEEAESKLREEEAERKRREEEAERKLREEEAERKRREEAEKKRREDAEKKRREDAERKRREDSERKRREDEDRAQAAKTSLAILSYQDFRNILPVLPKMVNLQKLVLQRCKIDDHFAINLADSMKNCKSIVTFDVQFNCIHEKGFKALIPKLKLLKLETSYYQGQVRKSGKYVGNRMSVDNVRELLKLPPPIDPDSLEMAAVGHVRIGTHIYPKIGVLKLQDMCLSEMNLGDAGAKIVSNSFSNMKNMRNLYFYKNAVGEEGANAFARQLPKAPVLEYLSLSKNHIPPKYIRKFEMMNRLREEAGLLDVDVDLSKQFQLSNDEEAEEIAREIPWMENGTEIDFYSQHKKFTSYGKSVIEAANESREDLDLETLTISF